MKTGMFLNACETGETIPGHHCKWNIRKNH